MSELPVGWVECSLEDLLGPLSDGKVLHQGWSPQCESTPAPEGEWAVLKTTAVQDGYFLEEENKKLPPALSPKPELEVRAGDLLMTCAGPRSRCGVICHVSKTRAKLIFSGKIYRFRPNAEHVEPKFLTHLLRTAELKEKIDEIKTGISESGMNMTRDRFFSLPVRLAPHTEQTRIAQKLDELLAQVETLKARINAIPPLLNRFRQSVLAAAISGRLTEEWRKATSSCDEKPQNLRLSDVASEIVDCPHSTPKWQPHGKTCVRTTEFSPGFLDVDAAGFVSEETYAERTKRIKPIGGDILYAREGTVGIACPVPHNVDICMGQRMVLIRASLRIHPTYLLHALNSEIVLSKVRSLVMGSTAPRVNVKDLKNFEIPTPSLDEQTEIVRRVEQLFAFADQLEAKIKTAQARINHLTQSILAKAFRGELVPQDPNDEPASVLLECIKAQRAAAPKAKRGRKSA